MVEEYFGFSGPPFKLSPDSKFFFGSKSHNKAMAYLHYGLRQAEGFIVITGEIGAGKSTLIEHMLDQLNRTNVSAAHLLTSNLGSEELLSHILSSFQIEAARQGRVAELEAFEDFLYDNINRGRRVLLVVDEVQNLPIETLEELRMLSNITHQGSPLFQVFLVGQPEFRETLARSDMEQLRQRIIASYHLEALDGEETRNYIEHRLAVVGRVEEPHFTQEAFDLIHDLTNGIPRRINSLCTRLILFCSLEQRTLINSAVVHAVENEMREEMGLPSLANQNEGFIAAPEGDTHDSEIYQAGQTDDAPNVETHNHKSSAGEASEQAQPSLSATGENDVVASLNDVRDALHAIDDEKTQQEAPPDSTQAEPAVASEDNDDSPLLMFDRLEALRGDVTRAHKGNRSIHKALCEMEERQQDNVIKMEEHLSKATALLAQID